MDASLKPSRLPVADPLASLDGTMISVTVPLCNEAGNIPTLYEKVRAAMEKIGRPWELILVNDGSTDESEALLDEIAAGDARVKVIHFRRNYGQTAAMMAGFDFARGDIVIPMDGDLQNDPSDIPKMPSHLMICRAIPAASNLPRNSLTLSIEALARHLRVSSAAAF